ncbi:MAG: CvpA family protein [Candidatus Omnitrophota bacterium]
MLNKRRPRDPGSGMGKFSYERTELLLDLINIEDRVYVVDKIRPLPTLTNRKHVLYLYYIIFLPALSYMPHINFNWVDILFVTILIRIGYISFRKGLLPEFFRLVGIFCAVIFTFNNYILLAQYIADRTKLEVEKLEVLSFVFEFFVILLIFKILAVLIGLLVGTKNVPLSSRVIGVLFGFARGLLVISLVYTLFINSPFEYLILSTKENAFSAKYIQDVLPTIYRYGINCYPGEKIETPVVEIINKNTEDR